jgi:arylsulfatase A-like enzyme
MNCSFHRSSWRIVGWFAFCFVSASMTTRAAVTAEEKPQSRPNVVLLLADDLGWGDLGYNANDVVRTPVLDEISRTGVRFDRFYAAANVCSPTRGSFLTGRHPVRYGVFSWGWPLRPEEITIAEILKAHGYATGHFGKWHLGNLHAGSATSPGAQGFDEWSSSPNFYENNPLFSRRGTVVHTQGESSAVTVDVALEFIEAASKRREPFLAVVWFGNPHTPHQALPELREPYAALDPKLQNYWGEITGIDRAVGRLRNRLRELNLADDTLLWFTSDNGAAEPGSTGGLRGKKGTLWEGGIRVPAVLEWPARVKRPTVVDVPCGTVDILPTVLAAVGVEHPQPQRPRDGQDLWPIVDGSKPERTGPLGFWTYPNRGKPVRSAELLRALEQRTADGSAASLPLLDDDERAAFAARYPTDAFPGPATWIDGRYKLHRLPRANQTDAFELYDLVADAQETQDLAASEPERMKKMATALEAWQRSVLHSLNGGDDGAK